MERASDHIVCMPMFNSYGLVDRVLTGNGQSSRTFVRVSDVASVFIACGIESDLLVEQLQQLEIGMSIEVPASQSQMNAFFDCSCSGVSSRARYVN
jgi:hypothetical protein